jgi:hypothetical protein
MANDRLHWVLCAVACEAVQLVTALLPPTQHGLGCDVQNGQLFLLEVPYMESTALIAARPGIGDVL